MADFVASRSKIPASESVWAVLQGQETPQKRDKGSDGVELFIKLKWYEKASVPVTRGDKAAARANRKYEVERVVKSGLMKKRLVDKELSPKISERVEAGSKAVHRAGLILAHIVLRALEDDLQLPVFDNTFFYNLLIA